MRSRIIDGAAITHVRRWSPPAMDEDETGEEKPPTTESAGAPAPAPEPETDFPCVETPAEGIPNQDEHDLDRVREEARQAGYTSGHAEGFRQGETEALALLESARQILDALNDPLSAVDARVEQELVKLVVAVARQLIRRELATDPGQIVAAVKEALLLLPQHHLDVVLHLNPEDARLIGERMHVDECERSYRIMEDPLIARGGCRVATDQSTVDATVESRVNGAIARVLGDERCQTDA